MAIFKKKCNVQVGMAITSIAILKWNENTQIECQNLSGMEILKLNCQYSSDISSIAIFK